MLRATLVLNVMSSPVITAHKTATLTHLRKLMRENNINHLPIVDDTNMPLGMVSAMDLNRLSDWRTHFKNLAHAGDQRDENLFDSLLAEEVMVRPVFTISQDAYVKEAADLFDERRIHSLPVVNRSGKIVGIVTAHDLLRLAYDRLTGPRN